MYAPAHQQAIENAEHAIELCDHVIESIDCEKAELETALAELGYKRAKALRGRKEAEALLLELRGEGVSHE